VDQTNSQNIFQTLARLSDALNTTSSTPDDFATILDDFDIDLDHILTNRSIVGSRINRMESSLDRFQAFEVFTQGLLSENEDADLADTITQLTSQTNVLNAALGGAARILQLSLIDFLAIR